MLINLNINFDYIYFLSIFLLIIIAFWNVSLYIDLINQFIQREFDKETLRREARKHKVTQSNANPKPDRGRGKDNRPWYKKKEYIVSLTIIIVGGVAAYFYFKTQGPGPGQAQPPVTITANAVMEKLILINNANNKFKLLMEVCYGNLAYINLHDFNQLVSETLLNVIKYTPDKVPALHAALSHANMIIVITESLKAANVSVEMAHLIAQATIIGATDGGVQELVKVTGASVYDAKIAYSQQLIIYQNTQGVFIDARSLAAYDLLPYVQVMGENLATMQINMMSNALIEVKGTGLTVSLVKQRAVMSAGEQTVKYVAAYGGIMAVKTINGMLPAALMTVKVTGYYAAQKATSVASIVAMGGLIGVITGTTEVASLAFA